MATGLQTSADISAVLSTVLSPARDVIEKPVFLEKMISHVKLGDGDGATYNWPKFPTQLSAQSLTEGVRLDNPQKLIPTSQQFTTSEVGIEVMMTDKSLRLTPEPMRARAGRFAGNAMKRKKEEDILALFAGLSRDLGSAGSAFSPSDLAVAKVRLQAAAESGVTEAAPGPYYAVIHPFHFHDTLVSAATLGSNINSDIGYAPIPGITEDLIKNYEVIPLYGVPVATHALMDIDSSDDAVGAVFSKEAFLYISTSNTMHTETDRDPGLRAWSMFITSEYGVGEVEDDWGFKITADATAPTS
jgi:hypothetical protein